MAYQLYDDWQGIWGDPEKTGKTRAGDIHERKKTLPVIYAREHLAPVDQQRLEALYGGGALDKEMVVEVLELLRKRVHKKSLRNMLRGIRKGRYKRLHARYCPRQREPCSNKSCMHLYQILLQNRVKVCR